MKNWVLMCGVLIAPGLWAREGVVETRDGKVYSGLIQLETNRIKVANATQQYRVFIELTNLLEARFAPPEPVDTTTNPSGDNPQQPTVGLLPAPWQSAKIGSMDQVGSARSSCGVFHLTSGGTNISGENDSFQFIYKPVTGDSEILVRLLQVRPMHVRAKAGLMLREHLSSESPDVFFGVGGFGGGVFQARREAGVAGTESRIPEIRVPCWLKLKRDKNRFSAYYSRNGIQWKLVHRVELAMAETAYVGVAVTGAQGASPAQPGQSYAMASRLRPTATLTQASVDHLKEAPFLPNAFVPRVELQNGSTLIQRIAKADETEFQLEGGILAPDPVPFVSVSKVLFQWVPTQWQSFLTAGRPGLLLANGDFLDCEFRSIEGQHITVSSVLLGLRTYDLNHDVLALLLRKHQPSSPMYEIETENGSMWYAQDLRLENGDVVIQQALLGTRKVPIYELRTIRRMGGESTL